MKETLPTLFIGGPKDGHLLHVHAETEKVYVEEGETYRLRNIEGFPSGVCHKHRIALHESVEFGAAIESLLASYRTVAIAEQKCEKNTKQ